MKKQLLTIALATLGLLCEAQQRYVGGDISLLPSYEASGAWYMDADNERITDMLGYLKAQGLNSLRVRLFVDPTQATQDEKNQGVRQDLAYVKTLGKRIKDAGFSLMLDFHYSDTWADPKQQITPAAWLSLGDAALQTKIYDYTKDCLQQMVEAGATPDFIQTGNEISYGMMWGGRGSTQNQCFTTSAAANWNRFFALLKKAGQACREVCPQAKIILHSERVPRVNVLKDWLDRMVANSIDYDIIGLSYYPYHHGSLTQLELALNQAENYGKDIMIVETGYYYAWQPNDVTNDLSSTWPITPAGQQQFAKDLIAKLKNHPKVTGLYWWFLEACENGVDWQSAVTPSGWYNASLFNDTNTSETGWGYGQVMPALAELKAFAEGSSGISQVKVTHRDGRWYSLQGMRYDAQPQRRGLYIVDGKKVFVK
ncbi:MAG: glycosyl hydrolase 53 family protein [Prevotella sp.]|nr:glycosyl hydrolase 53 family protein [Prevotella sp.]